MPATPHLRDESERFWEKVNKNGPVVRPDLGPCWLWTGAIQKKSGYGVFRSDQKVVRAHRHSFKLANGHYPRPDGCHKCDVRKCVRDSHIFEGTRSENMLDGVRKGRPIGRPRKGRRLSRKGRRYNRRASAAR